MHLCLAPWHGIIIIIIGGIAGAVCYWALHLAERRFDYDDSLHAFGVHGIGGLTGTILCGVFAT